MSVVNWNEFVATPGDATRYAIDAPFVINGMKYATNARIAIAVPCDEPDTATCGRRLPNVKGLFDGVRSVSTWHPMPDSKPCEACKGSCRRKCQQCDGKCYLECNLGHEHACENCELGLETCDQCSSHEHGVTFGDRVIALRFCSSISRLPGPVLWGVSGSDPRDPVCFKFDGGVGVVMPVVEGA